MNFAAVLLVAMFVVSQSARDDVPRIRSDLPLSVQEHGENEPVRKLPAWTQTHGATPAAIQYSPRDFSRFATIRQREQTWIYAMPGMIFAVRGDAVVGHGQAATGFAAYVAGGTSRDHLYVRNSEFLAFACGVSKANEDVRRCSELPQVLRNFILSRSPMTVEGRGDGPDSRKIAIAADDRKTRQRIAESFELVSDIVVGLSGWGAEAYAIRSGDVTLLARLNGQLDVVMNRDSGRGFGFRGHLTPRATSTEHSRRSALLSGDFDAPKQIEMMNALADSTALTSIFPLSPDPGC